MITSWTPTPVQQFVTIRPGVSLLRMRDFALLKHVSFLEGVLATRYIFDGTKNRLTMGMLPLEHLLIVIVDA